MTAQPHDSILIVDFGSQVTQLIARRVREAGVYSEIAPFNAAEEAFERMRPGGVILSGGPASVVDEGSPRIPQPILDSGVPLLGICYGQQSMQARSEEHTSELQSLMRTSYAVLCLKKKKTQQTQRED